MNNTSLVITSIADDKHPVLNSIAKSAQKNDLPFIVVGDDKNPGKFEIDGCEFVSIKDQENLDFKLVRDLPHRHYARKNIGYLLAMSRGAETIIETDDDNIPEDEFFNDRIREHKCQIIQNEEWVNIYKYFSKENIWPRGFAIDKIREDVPSLKNSEVVNCPIQQGLANDNPDVDALYRLTLPLPIKFEDRDPVLLKDNTVCPFNSQNTTWFEEAFPLMYLPSYCSFRMTDIWRSFVAQRVAWTCGWGIMFHSATVRQERNDHNLVKDFEDEISGYLNNENIMNELNSLKLIQGIEYIDQNMQKCYEKLIGMNLVDKKERRLLDCWLEDVNSLR